MLDRKIFNTQDLVLQVATSYDPARLPLDDWQRFMDVLCGTRTYQKEAITSALIYLASGRYASIEDLVRENAKRNAEIAARYHSLPDYERRLQLPQKLSATLDLATGAGKSFVMYAIAQIALGVDKALVLCPSLTIKDELTRKFAQLASDARLLNAIPDSAHRRNPRIINANETIKAGDVCVTNIHAVYSNTSSSILDSLGFGKGRACLVLSDEVHHAYNRAEGRDEESQSLKKWREFLLDDGFAFRFMLGFTGTAYVENDYFNDVIYRYSLREAIEDGFVKSVFYVHKDEGHGEHEKFQKIYQNHQRNKETYTEAKPLTILVTRDIKHAKQLHARLVEFLVERGEGAEDFIARDKALLITSHKDHRHNVAKLPAVDTDETTEWIISVAMLTEGWDVKNVFQIVPMEEKAFNSKLLIAQVLGRGLRLPEKYPQAKVTIFNHDKWSGNIANLVNEVLEIEAKLIASPLVTGERAAFHFTLHNFDYDKEPKAVDAPDAPETKVFNYKDTINLDSETFEHTTETRFISIGGKEEMPVTFKVEKEKTPISKIVDKIIFDFKTREWEGKTLKLAEHQYTQNNLPPRAEIEALLRRSMKAVDIEGDHLGNKNRQTVYQTFGTLLRRTSKSIVYEKKPNPVFTISTSDRESESLSVLALRHANATVFYTPDYESEIADEDALINFKQLIADDSLPRRALQEVSNLYDFKTPVDLVFVSHTPEREFIGQLTKRENAAHIAAWIKATNRNFYQIAYTLTTVAGRHTTQHTFNPDFFIKLSAHEAVEYIIVVETKADEDVTDENQAKLRYAREHFRDLNAQLEKDGIKQRYVFHFLSPANYPDFFDYLRDGRLRNGNFRSELENRLLGAN